MTFYFLFLPPALPSPSPPPPTSPSPPPPTQTHTTPPLVSVTPGYSLAALTAARRNCSLPDSEALKFKFNVALRLQRPYGLLGTGSPGRPPRLSHSSCALIFLHRSFVQCCFTSTETMRSIRDGMPRTATSTLTKLLSSEDLRSAANTRSSSPRSTSWQAQCRIFSGWLPTRGGASTLPRPPYTTPLSAGTRYEIIFGSV